MAIRMEVALKFVDWAQPMVTENVTPLKAYRTVLSMSRYKGFEYAEMLPFMDGEALLESRFKVEPGDNVAEKFAGYYQKE